MRASIVLVVLVTTAWLAGCGPKAPAFPDDLDDPIADRGDTQRDVYTLWWNGARIGEVEEEITRTQAGVRLERREHVVVRRGDRDVATRVTITIRTDPALRALEVDVRSFGETGPASARATRTDDGRWNVAVDGEAPRTIDGAAVPAELVALLIARDGAFSGDVMLPARGFATAVLRVSRAVDATEDDNRWKAELEVPGGRLVTTLTLDRDGAVLRVAGADGIVAVLATPADVKAPFEAPEVVDGTAIRLSGEVPAGARRLSLAMAPITRALPPALPGQKIAVEGDRWGLVLDPALPGALPDATTHKDRSDDIKQLVATVDTRLEEDLGVTAATMAAAREAKAGDCTTHALLFAALAGDAGLEVHLVTGFRVDKAAGLLVRHRWAIVWTGARWMAVDPTHGEAPASSFLIGLAIHGTRAEELAIADDVAFAGTGGARAKVQ